MVKKNLLIFFSVLILVSADLAGQKLYYANAAADTASDHPRENEPSFYFRGTSLENELNALSPPITGDHPFGDLIAKKNYLFEKKYISEIPVVPGNPQTKTQVMKPVIFNTTIQIEKSLKRSVKNGEISIESATEILSKVLDVALNVLTENTFDFEKAILSCNGIDDRIELFTKKVEIRY